MNVLTRDELSAAVVAAPRPEEDAMLMVARFVPLRPQERTAVLLAAPSVAALHALSHYDVERCIGRPLRSTRWEPARLHRETDLDRQWLRMGSRRFWWVGDESYPAHLRRIWDPPAILFGWGDDAAIKQAGIAVVGTRKPDDGGRAAAYRLGLDLGRRGVVVVSGLALGIDASAHRGAVMSGTPAAAVLGSGVDSVYPRENRALAADILDSGGIILSEYPPGTAAHRMRFPARNRIVVGLSAGVVVIQAPERSGALISADFGLDNGVEVMVHAAGRRWTGCRRLIDDGAPVIDGAGQVLNLLGIENDTAGSDQCDSARDEGDLEMKKLAMFGPDPEVFP